MSVVACTDCKRVLLAEHGPTCPECLAKCKAARPEPVYEAPESHQPVTPARLKHKSAEPIEAKGE